MTNDVIIHGGCRTVTGGGDAPPANVTFTHHGKLLLSITPKGKLIPGDGLARDAITIEIAEKLVEQFGYCYGSELRHAEARAKKAEERERRANSEHLSQITAITAAIKLALERASLKAKPKSQLEPDEQDEEKS
jgi:hypothetical protein